ncbi:hypothetical protein MJO28_016404 [Puccinia striiformis f. sp. tritici]|uniref:Uncharacterized protein n=1 Tax=Puccinia striiformis f. sp. tritici TaxID=168172 RepID=A0ACC0DQK4_9BASI|nr:hypothetical protein MJO28_016404 [Puccinia striiformis f. sp. tritici]
MKRDAGNVGAESRSIEVLTESTAKNVKTTAERDGEDDECTFISPHTVRPCRETQLYVEEMAFPIELNLSMFHTRLNVKLLPS